jgi:hypothetical protein
VLKSFYHLTARKGIQYTGRSLTTRPDDGAPYGSADNPEHHDHHYHDPDDYRQGVDVWEGLGPKQE